MRKPKFIFKPPGGGIRLSPLGVSVVCGALSLSLTLGTTLAAFQATKSVLSNSLSVDFANARILNRDGVAVNSVETGARGEDEFYEYTLNHQGNAAGYCEIKLHNPANDTTVSQYVYPITEDTTLKVQAPPNAEISFDYGWGVPAEANESNSVHPENSTDTAATQTTGVGRMRMKAIRPTASAVLRFPTPYTIYSYEETASLRGLAAHYGVSVEDILVYNGLGSQDEISVGDQLYIPNPTTTKLYTPAGLYRVVAGDSLQKIADAFGVTIRSLRQWNNIYDFTQLGVGKLLRIPVIYKPDPEPTAPEETVAEETTETTEATEATEAAETTETVEVTEPTETEETKADTATQPTAPEETKPTETVAATEPAVTEEAKSDTTDSEPNKGQTEIPERYTAEDGTEYVQGVPLYYQGDYPDTLYGSGTVKTSGCSVTSLTMVANAITGYDYTVDELADYFGGAAENNIDRLEKGSETLGLTWSRSENWDRTYEALQDGKIVIALMDGGINASCRFTNDQHFIVLTGLNDEGRILVNDSNRDNYSYWMLKQGFEKGFEPSDILPGYSGGWIYDRTPETMPARYTAYRAPKYQAEERDGGLSPEDRYLLACLIWGEARGEDIYGQQAVAEVALNRLASGQFGDTLSQVIRGEGQFRSVTAGQLEVAEPSQAQYDAIDRALFGKRILPDNIYYFSVYAGKADVYIQVCNHLFTFDESTTPTSGTPEGAEETVP